MRVRHLLVLIGIVAAGLLLWHLYRQTGGGGLLPGKGSAADGAGLSGTTSGTTSEITTPPDSVVPPPQIRPDSTPSATGSTVPLLAVRKQQGLLRYEFGGKSYGSLDELASQLRQPLVLRLAPNLTANDEQMIKDWLLARQVQYSEE